MECISFATVKTFLFVIIGVVAFSASVDAKLAAQSSCGVKFDGKCSCGVVQYDWRMQYVVNCTNTGYTSTDVLAYMPAEVEVLIFTGNRLNTLPWNIFGRDNDYPKLRIIDLSNNHIHEIHGKTFHHVQNVERLILNHNNISISPSEDEANYLHPRIFSNFFNLRELHLTNAFADNTSSALSKDLHLIFDRSNLTQLIKLHLEQNEIRQFSDHDVFCELPELEDLHLADNHLIEINFNMLCLKKLRFVDFERNHFTSVRPKDLDLLNLVSQSVDHLIVDFSLNPFTCNCSSFPFVKWLKTTEVQVRDTDELVCHRSPQSRELLIQQEFINCKVLSQSHYTDPGHTMALFFFVAIFAFIVIVIVIATIHLSKERIKHFVSPVISSRKVYYTTIKDDEVHEVIV